MILFRRIIREEDLEHIREITFSSGYFSEEEIAVAEEVALAGLKDGSSSGYEFIFADCCKQCEPKTAGYACFGKIPGTADSFDLYWLAVHQKYRAQGIGRKLIAQVEKCVTSYKGRKLFVETSSRAQYSSTRGFYRACGYEEEARLQDYYQQGEDQVVFSKTFLPQNFPEQEPMSIRV
jgi:ribosomal protein S18 acetylase RimI-like enzyme